MMGYMYCENVKEAKFLEKKANKRKDAIIRELPMYIRTPGTIGINVNRVWHPFCGWSIEADLTYNGEVIKKYEAFDLLELELTNFELNIICRHRAARLGCDQ